MERFQNGNETKDLLDERIERSVNSNSNMILFSSITSMLGNMGQCNYGVANGFLDGFAERNNNCISVNWGAWEVGMYAKMDERLKQAKGLDGEQAIPMLEHCMGGGKGTSFGVMKVDRKQMPRTFLTRKLVTTSSKQSKKMSHFSKSEIEMIVDRVTKEILGMERY